MSTAPSKLSSSESRCRRARQRGAVLVEYAFTFIFFMVLFLGIMGFGHALYAYHYVNNAARKLRVGPRSMEPTAAMTAVATALRP
jgi:Flp pilus assembly protein TadG